MFIELFIASLNSSKILEIKQITKSLMLSNFNSSKKSLKPPFQIKFFSPLDTHFPIKNLPPLEETGTSYEENARIKALWIKKLMKDFFIKNKKNLRGLKPLSATQEKKIFFLGEDSGLEIEALKGFPGLFSSRFAKKLGFNPSKLLSQKSLPIKEILEKLKPFKENKRKAFFKTALVVLDLNGKERIYQGLLEGRIHEKAKGKKGFGYDNLFIPKGESITLSEMGKNKKNKLSHRAKALNSFLKTITPRGEKVYNDFKNSN